MKMPSDNSTDNGSRGATIVLGNGQNPVPGVVYGDTPLNGAGAMYGNTDTSVPEKIRQMWEMYEYGDGSHRLKCRNFYRQGLFMADYEDDYEWSGTFLRYFPTYHDLNLPQLRGYFSWRTQVRKGVFRPTPTSFTYIYLYELLNGIGTSSVEDSLLKMREFETGYLDTGYGDPKMEQNLHRWMRELAIVNNLPLEIVYELTDPFLLERDRHITVLRQPDTHSDEEIFKALCHFATGNLDSSPVVTAHDADGKHLFAKIWRRAVATGTPKGADFIVATFGPWKAFPWYPFANAIYFWNSSATGNFEYELNESRIYEFHDGIWFERKFEELFYNKKRITELLHETDRRLRLYLKTGRPLRERPEESWAATYIEPVIEEDHQARLEAAKPKIHIDLGSLDHIREDAIVTRESLLSDEELQEETAPPVLEPEVVLEPVAPVTPTVTAVALDETHLQILIALLDGEVADDLLRKHKLMPSVVTDTINEAFFDEIGDSILDCDGEQITLVEDYIEDVKTILNGN